MKNLIACVWLLALPTLCQAVETVVHAGKLLDVVEGEVLAQRSILIEGGRVTGIEEGFVTPEGARVVDLSDAFVMPGLIDSHVHLDGELDPPASYAEALYMNPSDYALRATVYARRTLDAGFTTVRDLGTGSVEALLGLRDAIAR